MPDATVMLTVAAVAVLLPSAHTLLRQTTTNTARSPGDIVAGANLRYESVAGNGADGAPPGNWMICGPSPGAGNTTNTSLWRRVSWGDKIVPTSPPMKIAPGEFYGYDFTVEGQLDRICRNGHVQTVL